jgi:hypothetical protein
MWTSRAWIVGALALVAVAVEVPVRWDSLSGPRGTVVQATAPPVDIMGKPGDAARRIAQSDAPLYPLVRTPVGCVADLSAASLHQFVKRRIGPLTGWDNLQVYPLTGGRYLWLMQDSFLDDTGTATRFTEQDYLHNLAMVQDGLCFELVSRAGLDNHGRVFEPGRGRNGHTRFFWPLGGALRGERLRVLWAEMRQDDDVVVGIKRHPARTWLATYDANTLERLRFRRAPNDGVTPQWGFAVATEGDHSYLFGNDNQLNLEMVGGWRRGPHESTNTYVARVPAGRLQQAPRYWDGTDWVDDPAAAVAISSRFWTDNLMHPLSIGGRWVNVTKVDSFWGGEIVVDVADAPEGPWVTTDRFESKPTSRRGPLVTYHPVFLPYTDPDGRLLMVVSENAMDWDVAVRHNALYRPSVIAIDMPPAPSTVPDAPIVEGF